MSSGALSKSQAIDRETRTAYLVGFTGTYAQAYYRTDQISTHKCYKLLANIIWDWHWLSKLHPDRFAFPGIGDLVWVPHLYGGLGKVAPSIREPEFRLEHGLFAALSDLSSVGVYASHGLVRPVPGSAGVEVQFAKFMPSRLKQKSLVQPLERDLWEQLLSVYVQCSDEQLNALASCRTPVATVESLVVELIRWRQHMGRALRFVVEGRASDPAVAKQFQQARFCIHQFFVKAKFWSEMAKHRSAVNLLANRTEVGDLVPMQTDLADRKDRAESELAVLIGCGDDIHAMHFVCRQIDKRLHAERLDPRRLEVQLDRLAKLHGSANDIFDANTWHSLLFGGPDKDLAARGLRLIELTFQSLSMLLDRELPPQRAYYERLMGDRYPLPRDHFERGF